MFPFRLKPFDFSRILLLSVVFGILFHLPVALFRKSQNIGDGNVSLELVIALVTTFALFCLVNYISKYLITLFFAMGGAANYYLLFFKKTLDGSVLSDIASVEFDLILDYCNIYVLIFAIVATLLSLSLYKIKIPKIVSKIIAVCVLILLIFGLIRIDTSKPAPLSFIILRDYVPFNIFYSIRSFTREYLPHFNKLKTKNDIVNKHSFIFNDGGKPVTVVLIIGESMRGDLIELNGGGYHNMPLLSKRSNIVSFPDATGSATSTRISIPYMLTSAKPPNFDQALNERSIISIFKHLGFDTSWIGSQGVFGGWESTFASIMMEADHQIIKTDLQKALGRSNLYDEDLLFFLDERLKDDRGHSNFIVIHLLGSHWNLANRYPASFRAEFVPSCQASSPGQCSQEELFNAYNNTIIYSDYVLDNIIKRFEDRNALIVYASDHGFSLGEGGHFSNGYSGDNTPPEQLSIAFFTWASDSFLKNYGTNYQKIFQKKLDHITHDYIFHSLLDCINVKSDVIDKNLSLCK